MSDSPIISFRVFGTPAPQGSKTAYRRGRKVVLVESSKAVKPWRHTVTAVAKDHMTKHELTCILTGPVDVLLVFYRKPGTSTAKWKQRGGRPDTLPDLDKYVRSTLDALSGVVYRDDGQVCNLQARKLWAHPDEPEGVYISVCPIHEFGRPKRRKPAQGSAA